MIVVIALRVFNMVHDGNDEPKQAPEDMWSDIELRMTSRTDFEGTMMLWDSTIECQWRTDRIDASIKVRKLGMFVGMDAATEGILEDIRDEEHEKVAPGPRSQ